MPILDPNGNAFNPTTPPDADGAAVPSIHDETLWKGIDTLIQQARAQFGAAMDETFVQRREQLVANLLPGTAMIWRVFLGETALNPKTQGGQMIQRLLADSALQILVQWRLDMTVGQEIAGKVLQLRDAVTAPPESPPG